MFKQFKRGVSPFFKHSCPLLFYSSVYHGLFQQFTQLVLQNNYGSFWVWWLWHPVIDIPNTLSNMSIETEKCVVFEITPNYLNQSIFHPLCWCKFNFRVTNLLCFLSEQHNLSDVSYNHGDSLTLNANNLEVNVTIAVTNWQSGKTCALYKMT